MTDDEVYEKFIIEVLHEKPASIHFNPLLKKEIKSLLAYAFFELGIRWEELGEVIKDEFKRGIRCILRR